MAYANTSAATWADFCNALTTFLASAGWTVAGTAAAPIVTNANGHIFNIYTDFTNRNDYYSGAFVDRQMRVNYDRASLGAGAGSGYSNADSYSNDWTGPFPNVWFFGTNEYVHIVVQSAAQRYSHMSFGDLDNKGVHDKKVLFTAGKWWQYWSDQAQFAGNGGEGNPFNYPQANAHQDFMLQGYARLGVPDGLLDPNLLFRSGPVENPAWKQINDRNLGKNTNGNDSGQWLDYHCCIQNKAYTGGIIVGPMPVFLWNGLQQTNIDGRRDVMAYVGEFPDIGLVNMDLLSAGQIINFADDEWQVFPQKQYGTQATTKYASNPQPVCNTWNYGFAYKRVA